MASIVSPVAYIMGCVGDDVNSTSCTKFDDCNSEPLIARAQASSIEEIVDSEPGYDAYERSLMEKPSRELLSRPSPKPKPRWELHFAAMAKVGKV